MSMAAPHNQPTRGHHSRLWWRVLAELLNSFVTATTKETEGTLHYHLLPAGMAAYAGRTYNGKRTGQLEWEYAVASKRVASKIDPNLLTNKLTEYPNHATQMHPLQEITVEEGRSYTTYHT